jgi:hypothetical protein
MDFAYLSLIFLFLIFIILGVAGYDVVKMKKYHKTIPPLQRGSR